MTRLWRSFDEETRETTLGISVAVGYALLIIVGACLARP